MNENTRSEISKKILKSAERREIIIGSILIFIIFIANLGLTFYLKPKIHKVIIHVPQNGFLLNTSNIVLIGSKVYPTSFDSAIVGENDAVINIGRLEELDWYNFYKYYKLNLTKIYNIPENNSLRVVSIDSKQSIPFKILNNPYTEDGLNILLTFLNAQRCGIKVTDYHGACHLTDGQDIGKNLTGGWHDAGDYNKYSYNTAFTIYNLLNFYEDIDKNSNVSVEIKNKLYNEIIWGLTWLIKMQDEDGGVYNKISSGFDYNGKPEFEFSQRKTFTEKFTGTAAIFSAVTSYASYLFREINNTFSEELRLVSENAFNFMKSNTTNFQESQFQEYPGNNSTIGWASSELYRLTNDDVYLEFALKYLNYKNIENVSITNWDSNNLLGLYTLYKNVNNTLKDVILNYLIINFNNIRQNYMNNPFNIPHIPKSDWGVNSIILNHFRDVYILYELTSNNTYLEYCYNDINWIMGLNHWNLCFITGLGVNNPKNPYTRLTKQIQGGIVPGPIIYSNNYTEYIDTNDDIKQGYKFNEYTIDSNSIGIYCYGIMAYLFQFQ